jgi:hypothetical protein
MHRHLYTAALVMSLVVANAGCSLRRLPPPDAGASLEVRVMLERHEDGNLRTFVARNFRIVPRQALPSAWLPTSSTGTRMIAVTSSRRTRSMVFVLHEGGVFPRRPTFTLFPVSYPGKGGEGPVIARPETPTPATPPCESWSAFFVKGVGEPPKDPVGLTRSQIGGPSRSILIDPERHTLELQPVMRFSTRDVKDLRNRQATFLLGIRATAGATPFLILGVMRKPDGSYTEALFAPQAGELGWSRFVHTPGETTVISFYALDDSAALNSPCRAR